MKVTLDRWCNLPKSSSIGGRNVSYLENQARVTVHRESRCWSLKVKEFVLSINQSNNQGQQQLTTCPP
ncbi:hypothetical protein WN51_14660 [Melipona quadrifasciata]|uniref:Uncharacterized protein n=1 Tax=Melipona quadrifasciata TaxID=166423 RepID=A0A0M9A051_9HYME|nr:hypothetical protein WN51_14660 [Melipona quadrifasciata]